MDMIVFAFKEDVTWQREEALLDEISTWPEVEVVSSLSSLKGSRAYLKCWMRQTAQTDVAALCDKLRMLPEIESTPGPHQLHVDNDLN
jgi:hypothetical protein